MIPKCDDVILKYGKIRDIPIDWLKGEEWRGKIYDMWINMWDRVYSRLHWFGTLIQPKYVRLSNYFDDIMRLENFEFFKNTCHEVRWSIDKDLKGGKHYYFENLSLIPQSDNCKEVNNRCQNHKVMHTKDARKKASKARMKKVRGINIKDDSIITFNSINEAKDSGFHPPCIINCIKGRLNTYKGYKWEYMKEE